MKKLLVGLTLLMMGCASNETPEPPQPMCYKIFAPSDNYGLQGTLHGDFPSVSRAKLFLGYHPEGSYVVAIYQVDVEDRRDAEWHLPPIQRQTARCYRMSNGTMMHSLTIAPLEAECPCGQKDEVR